MKSRFLNKCKTILLHAFGRYLIVTNVISSGVLMGAGDAVEQWVEFRTKCHPSVEYDWIRLRDMTIVGFINGIPQHFFYHYLDKHLPGHDRVTVCKKIIFDQIIVSPTILIMFFHGLGLLQTGTLSAGFKELKAKFSTVYMIDCMFWPPVQMVNFYFLPPKHRVMYVNVMTMLYDIILSHIKFCVKNNDNNQK